MCSSFVLTLLFAQLDAASFLLVLPPFSPPLHPLPPVVTPKFFCFYDMKAFPIGFNYFVMLFCCQTEILRVLWDVSGFSGSSIQILVRFFTVHTNLRNRRKVEVCNSSWNSYYHMRLSIFFRDSITIYCYSFPFLIFSFRSHFDTLWKKKITNWKWIEFLSAPILLT